MTRAEMLDRMSGEELAQWRAFASREPIGQDRFDYLFSMLAAFLGSIIASKPVYGYKARRVTVNPDSVRPDWWRSAETARAAFGQKLLLIAKRHNQKMEIQRVKGESIG